MEADVGKVYHFGAFPRHRFDQFADQSGFMLLQTGQVQRSAACLTEQIVRADSVQVGETDEDLERGLPRIVLIGGDGALIHADQIRHLVLPQSLVHPQFPQPCGKIRDHIFAISLCVSQNIA